MKRTLARIMASVKKGSTSVLELHDISAPLAEWIADHVNDSGYRELHRYQADDADQLLADMRCESRCMTISVGARLCMGNRCDNIGGEGARLFAIISHVVRKVMLHCI